MGFSPDFINKVKDSTDIVDIVSQHVELKRVGSNIRGVCPLPGHIEKSPSFFVNDAKQFYHCFGCNKGGDVFNFLNEMQGLAFPDAVEFLAKKAGIPIPQDAKQYSANSDSNSLLFKMNEYVADFYRRSLTGLNENSAPHEYLKKRGLTQKTIDEFQLGYSPKEWSSLTEMLKRGKAPLDVAIQLGLIKSKTENQYYDIFRDRIMFPIISPNGNVLGFGGRSLTDENQPKYLNSSDSPVFSKGNTLYGLNIAAKHIRSQGFAYLVEGYMDCIMLHQHGIQNTVATLGTALTPQHVKLIKKLADKVVVVFDGDRAGISAADRSLPIFLEGGIKSKHLLLPDELDPDEFVQQFGREEFSKRSVESPDHFLSWVSRQMIGYRGQPSQKVELINKITPLLDKVSDPKLKDLFQKEVAERLGIQPSMLVSGQKMAVLPKNQVLANKPNNLSTIAEPPKEEVMLLQLILHAPKYLKNALEAEANKYFENELAAAVAQKAFEKYCQNPGDFDSLSALLKTEFNEQSSFISRCAILPGQLNQESEEKMFVDCLRRVKERYLKRQAKEMLSTIKSQQSSDQGTLESYMKIARVLKGKDGDLS